MTQPPARPHAPNPGAKPGRYDSLTGRCIYCDQRCDAQLTYHDYCREAQVAAAAQTAPHTSPP